MTLEKIIHVEELHAKTMRGSTNHVLKPGESHKITDSIGFELFKVQLGSDNKAEIFVNGKKFIS